MRIAFTETLSGGVHPPESARPQAVTLELTAAARGIVDAVLGAPFEVQGSVQAEPSGSAAALLPRRATVTGTLRFLLSAGLFYDLRIAEHADTPARDQLELRGARRFARGDLFTSATTFDGVLVRRGAKIADVRLRFDARDDVPRLVRSLRLG